MKTLRILRNLQNTILRNSTLAYICNKVEDPTIIYHTNQAIEERKKEETEENWNKTQKTQNSGKLRNIFFVLIEYFLHIRDSQIS